MKTIKGLLILLLFTIAFAACKKDKPADAGNEMKLLSFMPDHGTAGAVVKLSGANFSSAAAQNQVKFNGVAAAVIAATENELIVKVPLNAVSGKISVSRDDKTVFSTTDFTVEQKLPQDLAFTPVYGQPSTEITLVADNISSDAIVLADNNSVTVLSKTEHLVKFKLPATITPGEHAIALQTGGKTYQLGNFIVIAPGTKAAWVKLSDGHPFIMYRFACSFVLRNQIHWGFTQINNEGVHSFFTALYNTPELNVIDWTRVAYTGTLPAEVKPTADGVAAVLNEKAYFGTGFTNQLEKNWWLFNEGGTVQRLTDYPEPTAGALSFVLNGHLYVGFGGLNKKLYRFIPEENNNKGSWQLVLTANTFDFNKAAAFVIDGAAYLGRAVNTVNGPRTAVYKFTEPTTLSPAAIFPEDVPAHVTPSFVLGNKGYLVTGRNVWQFTPDAGGGNWQQVLTSASGPTIQYAAVVEGKAFGWTDYGALYQFALP